MCAFVSDLCFWCSIWFTFAICARLVFGYWHVACNKNICCKGNKKLSVKWSAAGMHWTLCLLSRAFQIIYPSVFCCFVLLSHFVVVGVVYKPRSAARIIIDTSKSIANRTTWLSSNVSPLTTTATTTVTTIATTLEHPPPLFITIVATAHLFDVVNWFSKSTPTTAASLNQQRAQNKHWPTHWQCTCTRSNGKILQHSPLCCFYAFACCCDLFIRSLLHTYKFMLLVRMQQQRNSIPNNNKCKNVSTCMVVPQRSALPICSRNYNDQCHLKSAISLSNNNKGATSFQLQQKHRQSASA